MKYRITAEGVLETPLSGFDLINFPILIKDGVANPVDEQSLESRIRANVWEPVYLPYRFVCAV